MQFKNHKTWIEISEINILHNISQFRKLIGNRKIAAVVKANAYGHGIKEVVGIIKDKVDWFAVDSLNEALELRNMGFVKPIVVLGYIPTNALREAIENDISFVLYNLGTLKKLASYYFTKVAKVHLKIETGLNRQGIPKKEILRFIKLIKKTKGRIIVEGVSTHFANIEDTLDPKFAFDQLERFNEVVKILKEEKINPKVVHCAASAATLLYPKTHFSMIRLGIGMYGLWPSKETKIALKLLKRKVELKSVLCWKSVVAQVKKLNVGDSVGYGRTWFAAKGTKIAVIPVGYSDGFDRKLSNMGRVLIKGEYAPVIGRVAMNMFMVDVGEIDCRVGDEVVIIGSQEANSITAEEIAEKIGTINYEVIARLNPLISKIIVK